MIIDCDIRYRMKNVIIYLLVVMAAVSSASCGSATASNKTRQVIYTSEAPTPVATYSQAILFGDTLNCAGQIGLDPVTNTLVPGGVTAEAEQALKNLGAVLRAAGMSYSDVVMATVFLTDINNYSAVNTIYANYFTSEPPARQVIEIGALPLNASVEISLVAMKEL